MTEWKMDEYMMRMRWFPDVHKWEMCQQMMFVIEQ